MSKVGQITATLRTRCAQGGSHFQIGVPKVALNFEFQTRGLETWMGSIPRTSVSFFILCFCSLAQPIAGHIQKNKYRKDRREHEQNVVSHFCICSGPIAVGLIEIPRTA